MSYTLFKTAAFGSSKVGLSTVGYRLYDANGSANGSRITAGVQDLSGGQYGALVTFPDSFEGRITWDSGEGSPVFASEEINPQTAENSDAKISSRSTYDGSDTSGTTTLLSRLSAARAGYLDVLNGIVAAIWAAVVDSSGVTTLLARIASALTITGGKVEVNDKTGFSLTAAYDPAKTAAQAGNQMDLVNAPNSVALDAIAVKVEAHLLDEGDSQMLINAIVGAIGNVNIDQTVLVAAIRADLERSGGNLNTVLARLTATRAGLLDNLDVAVSSRGTGTALDAAGVRSAVGMALANLDTQLDALPTNAELTTALASADDATLAAIAALAIPTANQNANALLDLAAGVETGLTFRQALRLLVAAETGKLSGAASTTITIRSFGDNKDRIVATVSPEGNRTALVYDLT